ncbi:MAG: metallophosphoesterase [Phycisphaeraceae bacterium]|nr:metallophosphoesterase [Phycisphaeraceae bacterium]
MTQERCNAGKVRWLAAWTALALLMLVLHKLAWAPPDSLEDGLSALSELPGVKSAANAAHLLLGPFWVVCNVLTKDWGVYNFWLSALACLLASGVVLLVVRRAVSWRASKLRNHAGDSSEERISRRRFLVDSPLLGGAALLAAVGGHSAAIAPYSIRLRRYRVPIHDLPESFDGLRAIFIADTHLGPRVPAAYIRDVIATALSLKPDLALLGGDYVHAGTRYIKPAAAMFRPLVEAGVPVVGVLGNHDWYNSRGLVRTFLEKTGVHMVDNARVFLDAQSRRIVAQPPSSGICIAGVGDFLCDVVDADRALAGVPSGMPRVLLSHNPDVAELPTIAGRSGVGGGQRRIDLMLSGHTHGGQIGLPFIGPLYVPGNNGTKYAGGFVQGPAFPVIVSRGVGMSICPIRFCVPPELVEVKFTRA